MKFPYYQQITTSDALKLEKMRVWSGIEKSSKRLKKRTLNMVSPKESSLMHSDIGIVRYAAWGITIFKTYNSLRKMLRILRK